MSLVSSQEPLADGHDCPSDSRPIFGGSAVSSIYEAVSDRPGDPHHRKKLPNDCCHVGLRDVGTLERLCERF